MKPDLALLTILLVSVPASMVSSRPTVTADERPRIADDEAQRFRAAAEYSRSQHGVAVLVMRRGEVVFEDYAPGWSDKPHLLASGTKSFCGVMAACAVQDGLLTLDERVADTLIEWKDDPTKSLVTIRQLLSLSSGVKGGATGSPPSYRRAVAMAEAIAEPGTRFSYGPIPFQCFGELMRRKLVARNESVEAYLTRRVLAPVGLKVGSWREDSDGNINLPSGAFLTAREWAKFGELVRLGGKWKGQQLIPEALLKECFIPASANPRYGLTFWLLGRDGDGAAVADGVKPAAKAQRAGEERRLAFQPPGDTVAAMGKGKQRCYAIPSLELVIVRMGDSVGQEFSDVVFLAKLLGPRRAPVAVAPQPPPKPNVLMIIADDLNDWIGCLNGHAEVKTPNLDRLARRGLLFANAHCVAPLCNPSRVATFTGRRPSTTGVYLNGVVWHDVLPGIRTIPQHFKANGYYVAGGGKVYHHPPGFNRRSDWNEYFDQVFDGHYQARLARGEDPATFAWPEGFPLNQLPAVKALARPPQNPNEFDWGPFDREDLQMGDGQMVQWAEKSLARPPKQPFFLAAGIYRPHLPWYAPRKYFDMYPPDRVTMPAVKADDLNDVPEIGRQMAADRRGDLELVTQAGQYRQVLQAYLANITFCDALIGRLLDALDAGPAAKNTIIVLWSDNGWHFGEKQHLHKSTLWQRSTHVPFLIVAPGVTREQTRTSRPVSLIDVFPTLNEMCGLPQPANLDGVSLMPLLKEPMLAWERPAVTTHQQGNHAVRSERWRYIRYADGGEELYDQQNDPNEWANLAGKPEFATVKADLSKWLPKTDAPSLSQKGKRRKDNKPE